MSKLIKQIKRSGAVYYKIYEMEDGLGVIKVKIDGHQLFTFKRSRHTIKDQCNKLMGYKDKLLPAYVLKELIKIEEEIS